jgi:hypothetical protein
MKQTVAAIALITLAHSVALCSTVYNNSITDTGDTIFYSVGPYSEIGDVIQLAGTERATTVAQVQFYNGGAAGSLDAILRFYALGPSPSSPVGAQIGPDFTALEQVAPGLASFGVTFDTHGIIVPDQLVFTVSVVNVIGAADVGLNLFDPPVTGSSDNLFLLTRDANGFARSAVPNSDGNLYLQLEATAVPEPSTLVLAGLALACMLAGRGCQGDRRVESGGTSRIGMSRQRSAP